MWISLLSLAQQGGVTSLLEQQKQPVTQVNHARSHVARSPTRSPLALKGSRVFYELCSSLVVTAWTAGPTLGYV